MNEEALYLRQEISRLKAKLATIEDDEDSTSLVCGHDVALTNLKKLVKEHELNGLSQYCFVDNKWGWTTTNIDTSKIDYYLENKERITALFNLFSYKEVWDYLVSLYKEKKCEISDKLKKELVKFNIIDNEEKITQKGILAYFAFGHIAFNICLKQDIEKTSEIFMQLFELTKKQFETPLGISFEEMLDLLSKKNKIDYLHEKGITIDDLKKYYYQYGT